MIRVFDYVCADGHRTEQFVAGEVPSEVRCACGKSATRAMTAPAIKLEGWSGSFPGRAMKWEREHFKAGFGSHDRPEE